MTYSNWKSTFGGVDDGMKGEDFGAVFVVRWFRARLVRRAALISGVGSTLGAALVVAWIGSAVGEIPTSVAIVSVLGSGLTSALVAWQIVERFVSRRLREVAKFADDTDEKNELVRLPNLGEDEIADAGDALNRLLVRLTTLRVSMIDTNRELVATQAQLQLKEEIAQKNVELEERARERAIVFDLLRLCVTSLDLEQMLRTIAERIGTDLKMRETAVVIREDGKRYTIRATHGFANPQRLSGRVVDPKTGVTGRAVISQKPVICSDVTQEPDYLSFWGEAAREGSFAAFPVLYKTDLLGVIAVTRKADSPFLESDVRTLTAIADQASLAIRHAQLFEELQALSTTDALTGLPNRRLLARRLDHEIDRAVRFRKPVSVLAVDIDHFKNLNDTLGHPTGDAALCEVAEKMQHAVRRVDTVARMGGEEFLVLLPETDGREAMKVADKLRSAVENGKIPGAETQPEGKVTISLGVATLADSEDATSLLSRADEALYSAKRRGRNRVVAHEEGVSLVPNPPTKMEEPGGF